MDSSPKEAPVVISVSSVPSSFTTHWLAPELAVTPNWSMMVRNSS